jgi:hypothetical protein
MHATREGILDRREGYDDSAFRNRTRSQRNNYDY